MILLFRFIDSLSLAEFICRGGISLLSLLPSPVVFRWIRLRRIKKSGRSLAELLPRVLLSFVVFAEVRTALPAILMRATGS